MPSTSPTRKTASHSRPLAACSDARVTPSTVGACWASARSARSPTKPAQVQRRGLRRPGRLGEVDQRGQRLPALAGRPAGRRPVLRPAGRGQHVADRRHQRAGLAAAGAPRRAAAAPPRGPRAARRTARRPGARTARRRRPAPPRRPRDCALIRNSTAISRGRRAGVDQRPAAGRRRRRPRPARRGARRSVGSGPVGRWPSSRSPGSPLRRGAWPISRLASADDLRRRAVVAHQPDHRGVGIAVGEAEQVVGVGAGEGVDRLVGVADDAEVVPAAEPGVEQPLLQRVDVLVLVDDEVPVLRRGPRSATSGCSSSAQAVTSSRSSKSSDAVALLGRLVAA